MGLYDRDYMRAPRPNKVASRVFESGSSIVRGGGSGSSVRTLFNFMLALLGLIALGWICWQTYSGVLPNSFSSISSSSTVGTWRLDKASSIAARRVFLERMMLDSKNSNGQVDLGDWFFAQMIGEITQASLEAQAADWEMEVTLKSNQTFTFKELTWLYDFESGGTWQYSNVDNIAIQLDLQDVGIIDGRLVHGQLQLIAIEPNSKIEFPLAVMTKCWW